MRDPSKWICVMLLSLLLVSCGDASDNSRGPIPNLRGTWFGTFVSNNETRSLRIHIDSQNGRNLEGTWQNPDGTTIGFVGGYLSGKGEITFEVWSDENIGCDGLWGYYVKPYFER